LFEISIIMACYNSARHLSRAVSSVKQQSLGNWELIVVDDASADETAEVVEALAAEDSRIKFVKLTTNSGPSVARNAGLEIATGRWIAILDSDDAFEPKRLETLIQMGEHLTLDMVFDNLSYFDDAAGIQTGTALPRDGETLSVGLQWLIHSERPSTKFKVGFLKPIIRRDFLVRSGIRYSSEYRFAEDFDLYARLMLEKAKALYTSQPLYIYTTQIGKKSRSKSSGTRTVFNPGLRVHIAERLIADYGETIGKPEQDLLTQLRAWQVLYSDVHEMARRRHRWDLIGFASIGIANPAAIAHYLSTTRVAKSARKLFGSRAEGITRHVS